MPGKDQTTPKKINIGSYDYDLPLDRIAQFPVDRRDQSKLLVLKEGRVTADSFFNLSDYLPENSLMVFNETKVIHARLLFQKDSGSTVELFCLEPVAPYRDHQRAFQQKEWSAWKCLVGNSKRWKKGVIELNAEHSGIQISIKAERINKLDGGTSHVMFNWLPSGLTFAEVLEYAGKIPLPPYISRKPIPDDEQTYQTIYARQDGSVAAPTAGLHFTPEVFRSLKRKNISTLNFTLHVGAGTFRPVVSSELEGHVMHAEHVEFPLENLEFLRQSIDKPIITVGTTTARMMESLYWHGVKIIKGLAPVDELDISQWVPYEIGSGTEISRLESLVNVIEECKARGQKGLNGSTRLMIAPGYRFRYTDVLITNFHQPRSTLLLLIAAFIGEDWKKAYEYALKNHFRFLSYGDSCLFFR